MEYVALLRGIGPGNPSMRNDKLRGVLEDLGLDDVRSVISSGNLLFTADTSDLAALEDRIERAWPEALGFRSTTILRTAQQLRDLVAAAPFGDREDTPDARCNVTFLKHAPEVQLEVPCTSPDGASVIVAVVDRAICSVVDLTGERTPDLMRWLERTYGKQVTTRTWRTVHRIVQRLA